MFFIEKLTPGLHILGGREGGGKSTILAAMMRYMYNRQGRLIHSFYRKGNPPKLASAREAYLDTEDDLPLSLWAEYEEEHFDVAVIEDYRHCDMSIFEAYRIIKKISAFAEANNVPVILTWSIKSKSKAIVTDRVLEWRDFAATLHQSCESLMIVREVSAALGGNSNSPLYDEDMNHIGNEFLVRIKTADNDELYQSYWINKANYDAYTMEELERT